MCTNFNFRQLLSNPILEFPICKKKPFHYLARCEQDAETAVRRHLTSSLSASCLEELWKRTSFFFLFLRDSFLSRHCVVLFDSVFLNAFPQEFFLMYTEENLCSCAEGFFFFFLFRLNNMLPFQFCGVKNYFCNNRGMLLLDSRLNENTKGNRLSANIKNDPIVMEFAQRIPRTGFTIGIVNLLNCLVLLY